MRRAHASTLRTRLPLAWLLALMLLWPLAQSVASRHLLSHVPTGPSTQSTQSEAQDALHTDPCQLCLGAQAVLGGALAAPDVSPPFAVARSDTPALSARAAPCLRPARAYQSRAPPLSLV